jgi:hypothetical protein
MSAVTDKTWDVFRTASFSDDDLGYPDDVEFVPGDQEWADDVVCVTVGQRVNGHAPAYMTASRLGRHPLREMREF